MLQFDSSTYLTDLMDIVPNLYRMMYQSVQQPEVSSLPATQLRALFLLTRHGMQSMSVLAEALSIPRQQLTKVVHALVEKRLVRRKVNTANRRMILIEMTPKGNKLMKAILKNNLDLFSPYFDSLTPEQHKTMQEASEILRNVLLSVEDKARNA